MDSNIAKRIKKEKLSAKPAFSLVEAVTALIILALVSSSVLVVINRCTASAADSVMRMQAFEVVRDNMETLQSSGSVGEMVEYGSSDKYPQIQWQSVVETFYEPLTSRMWIRAVCSAEYTDTEGQEQTVELTHWLTDLTKEQLVRIMQERRREKERLAEQGEDKQVDEDEPKEEEPKEDEPKEDEPKKEDKPEGEDELICGYTYEELFQMTFEELMEIFWSCDEI